MGDRSRVHLYCEDSGHEQFTTRLLHRLARESVPPHELAIETISGRGGHGRAIQEFRAWQRRARKGGVAIPDLLVVVIDGNCGDWSTVLNQVRGEIDQVLFARSVVGCPDPHIERWCLADPEAFAEVVGAPPLRDPGKCQRELYKRLLRESIEGAGQPILTNEMEYAPDLVDAMDLFRAGKNLPGLRSFVQDLRGALRSLPPGSSEAGGAGDADGPGP